MVSRGTICSEGKKSESEMFHCQSGQVDKLNGLIW